MTLMPIKDIIGELNRLQRTLMEMERIKGPKYSPAVDAVIDAKIYLSLINAELETKWRNDPNIKFAPIPKLEPKEEAPSK